MKLSNSQAMIPETAGSSLSGYVTTTYDRLCEVFGEPTYSTGDPYEKVQTEWVVSIKGVTATIYNWKTGSTPVDSYNWHIGGFGKGEVDLVQEVV